MPRKSISSSEPTCTSPSCPNSAPSKSTRSKVACDPSASKLPSSSSEAPTRRWRGRAGPLGGEDVVLVGDRPPEHVVALELHLGGEAEQRGAPTGTNTDAVSPRARARTKRPTAWAKNSGVEVRGRVDPDGQPRHVDALGDHPDRDHPARVGRRRTRRSAWTRAFSSDRTTVGFSPLIAVQQRGVGPRGVLVGGDDQAAGVGHVAPDLGQPAVGRGQHGRDPVALAGRARSAGLRREVLGQRLAEPGRHLVAGPGAPAHLAGVGHEQHRPDDVVAQGVAVAVGVVGDRARHAVAAGLVSHERDRVDVGAERRAGQGQPPGGGVERLAHRLAPRQRITGVVHLVEDHQGPEALHPDPHRQRVHRDAGVGDRDAEEVAGGLPRPGGEGRVDRDPGPRGRLGPLELEVLGRRHHDDPVDDPAPEQLGGDRQRERGLAGAGRRDREEVARARGRSTRSARRSARRAGSAPCPTPPAPATPE